MTLALLLVLAQTAPPPAPPAVHRVTEIVVTGSRGERARQESTTAVEVIDRQDIEAAGAETVADVLENHPGVELEPGLRGFTVRLQGLDPEYVLVLVDGERVLGRLGGAIDLTRFQTDAVERIEIVKGAGSALYGADAVAGVINIITRTAGPPLETGGHVSGGTGGAMDVAYHAGIRRPSFDALASFGHHRADAWDRSPETPETTGSGFKSSNMSLSGGWRPIDRFRVGSRVEYARRQTSGVGGSATGALFDRRTLSEQLSATVQPEWRFAGSRLQLTGHYGLFADQFLSDQRGDAALDQLQKSREQLGKGGFQLDLAFNRAHAATLGAEVMYEQMSSDRLAGGAADRTRAALFGQHEWLLGDRPRLAVQPGIRLDGDSQFGPHVSPKLAVRLDPHQRLLLRASYGWGYRAPSFQELYIAFDNPGAGYMVSGNPALRPERSRSFNVGAEWRPPLPGPAWSLSLGAFRSDIDDLIIAQLANPDVVGAPSTFSYANVARAHSQGLEAGLGAEPLAGLRLDLGYTLTLARDDEQGRALEGRARHRGTIRLGYRHARLGFTGQARATLVGRRPFYVDSDADGVTETDHADPHATVGLRLAQVVWRRHQVFVGGDNLMGAGDERYLPIMPRTFYGGLDFGF